MSGLQAHQFGAFGKPREDHPRLLAPEGADALETQVKRGRLHRLQRMSDVAGEPVADIADEAQGDVIGLRLDPARAAYAAAHHGQFEGDIAGDLDTGEEARHGDLRIVTRPSLGTIAAGRKTYLATASTKRRTAGRMLPTITSTPLAVGCMPSDWFMSVRAATPLRKNG